MESTTLNLHTRDGMVAVLIAPPVDADHYGELYDAICHAATADELRANVKAACLRWDREVHFG